MSKYDWEAIEREYRAGQLSIREIARQYGASEGAIRKKAKQKGWKRDLTDKIRKRAKEKLVEEEARGSVQEDREFSDDEIVEAGALREVEIINSQKQDLSRLANLLDQYLNKLEGIIQETEVGYLVQVRNRKGEILDERVTFSFLGAKESLADALDKAARTMEKKHNLQRKTYNLDEADRKAQLMLIEVEKA